MFISCYFINQHFGNFGHRITQRKHGVSQRIDYQDIILDLRF